MSETSTTTERTLERDVDRAIADFFEQLLLIANRRGVNAWDVMDAAERRGCGGEGFENWLGDED